MRQSFKFPAAFDSHDQRGLKYRFIAITQITATRRTYPSCSTSTAFESCLHVAKTNHCEDKCVPVCFRQHLQALEIHANHANFVRKNRLEESPSHEVSKNRRKNPQHKGWERRREGNQKLKMVAMQRVAT